MRDPINERAFQVTLGKRDEVIQAFSAGLPHQSFAVFIPSEIAPVCGAPARPCFHTVIQVMRVDAVPVMDHVLAVVISGQRLAKLLQRQVAAGWAVTF